MKKFVCAAGIAAAIFSGTTICQAEIIKGTNGNDTLVGNDGAPDTIKARGGNDTILLLMHAGWDTIYCGAGSDTLDMSGVQVNEVTGFDLSVGRGSNSQVFNCENIVGTNSSIGDRLIGDGGNNRLTGGLGADVLTGNSGADTFVYDASEDSPPSGPDVITDFNAAEGDSIEIVGIAVKKTVARLNVTGKSLRKVVVNLNGDGKVDLAIFVRGRNRPITAKSIKFM